VGSKSKNHRLATVNTIITNGPEDLKAIHLDGKVQNFKSTRSDRVIKTTGAGDTLTGVICSMLLRG
jgi:sugar/nucleoside kinase (ribokinase family)